MSFGKDIGKSGSTARNKFLFERNYLFSGRRII